MDRGASVACSRVEWITLHSTKERSGQNCEAVITQPIPRTICCMIVEGFGGKSKAPAGSSLIPRDSSCKLPL